MPNDETTPPPQSPPTQARRSSFAGQTLADLFGSGRNSTSRSSMDNGGSNSPPNGQAMGPITQAAAHAQRRRMSLTTLGMGGSAGQNSSFGGVRGRHDSLSSVNSGSIDESAIEDDVRDMSSTSAPQTSSPFARRMSFGAQALRDVRNSRSGSISTGGGGGGVGSGGSGGAGQNGRSPPTIDEETPYSSSPSSTSPSQKTSQGSSGKAISARSEKGREGFNWSDNLRTRAERTSIAGPPPGGMPSSTQHHARAKSTSTMDRPVAEMPKPQKRPDHFQERILKGDFYMD